MKERQQKPRGFKTGNDWVRRSKRLQSKIEVEFIEEINPKPHNIQASTNETPGFAVRTQFKNLQRNKFSSVPKPEVNRKSLIDQLITDEEHVFADNHGFSFIAEKPPQIRNGNGLDTDILASGGQVKSIRRFRNRRGEHIGPPTTTMVPARVNTSSQTGQMVKTVDSSSQTSALDLYESTKLAMTSQTSALDLAQTRSNCSRLSSMSPRLQLNKSLVKQIIAYIHSDPLAKVHKLLTFDQVFFSYDEELVYRLFFEVGTRGRNLTESVKQDYFGDDFDWDFWYDGTFCSDQALEHKKVLKLTEQELFSDDSGDDFFD